MAQARHVAVGVGKNKGKNKGNKPAKKQSKALGNVGNSLSDSRGATASAPPGQGGVSKQASHGSGTGHLNTSANALVDRTPITVLEDMHRHSVQDLVFGPDGCRLIWLSLEAPTIEVWNVMAAITANLGTPPLPHSLTLSQPPPRLLPLAPSRLAFARVCRVSCLLWNEVAVTHHR